MSDTIFTSTMYILIALSGAVVLLPGMPFIATLAIVMVAYLGLTKYPSDAGPIKHSERLISVAKAFIGGVGFFVIIAVLVFADALSKVF